jgi:alkylation response protein AidB-like acyl-CoA dehydrogenase
MNQSMSQIYQSMQVKDEDCSPLQIASLDFGERTFRASYNIDEPRNALVRKAASFAALLTERADEIDRMRRIPQDVIDELADAGLFKLTVPKRYGGHETDVRTVMDVAATLAESCASTAWVVTLVNAVGLAVGVMSENTQDEVFGVNPNARVAGVFSPRGKSRRVEGGFRVTGKWYYGSGTLHSDWVMVGLPLVNDVGETVDFGLGLIPRPHYTIEDTWFVVGMRGSGSNAIVADDVFIPDHRIIAVSKAIVGDYPTEFEDEALYHSAFVSALTVVLAGPQLGLGRAALRLAIELASKRSVPNTIYVKQSDSVGFQIQIAEAAMLIDTAHLHAYRAVADIDDLARRREYPGYLTRARIRADAARAATAVKEAIDILLDAHGAGSFAESSPMQRIWRDSNIAVRHGALVPAATREIYGKALLGFGIEDNITKLL